MKILLSVEMLSEPWSLFYPLSGLVEGWNEKGPGFAFLWGLFPVIAGQPLRDRIRFFDNWMIINCGKDPKRIRNPLPGSIRDFITESETNWYALNHFNLQNCY